MSTSCLRIIDTPDNDVNSLGDKQKSKRGRPRKSDALSETDSIVITKKRGRKKKADVVNELNGSPEEILPSTKSYIVKLKIKSSDLNKVQTQFIENNQTPQFFENTDNFREYYTLLNNLELPITSKDKKDLPEISDVYKNTVVPILPENVPIKLFNEKNIKLNNNAEYRTTQDILLPLLLNGDKWAEKSPYACWNCDSYFSGTPIGIPEKESGGFFHCCGNLCTFECAARYLVDHATSGDFWNKYSLLCMMYQMAYNLPPETKVKFAPPKVSLMKYGGTLTYDMYHNRSDSDPVIEIYQLPIVPVLLHIGEMYKSTDINNIIRDNSKKQRVPSNQTKTKNFIPIDPAKITQAEENISQKKNSIAGSKYNLDKCLNISHNKTSTK